MKTNGQWTEKGRNKEELGKKIQSIPSPYEPTDGKPPPFCYPGTNLGVGLVGRAKALLAKQINGIGSHTHGQRGKDGSWTFRAGEGGFEMVQRMEAEVIWMFASIIGGARESVDGYFCGGGTEANIEGLWIGREYLNQCPDPMQKGTVVLATPLLHYSIIKATEILDLGHPQWITCTHCGKAHLFMPDPSGAGLNLVGMDEKGQMCLAELERTFTQKYHEGFRRFLIAPTVGTSLMGSIDPIKEIGQFITTKKRETNANFYLHVDASFAGFTVPFVNPGLAFGFNVPEVMSITFDGDKMGRLPYPAGIFLCRKDLMSLVARKVNYVRGHQDDTLSGSRSCLSPVLAWYLYQGEGLEGQRQYVKDCLNGRDQLVQLIKEKLTWVKTLPCSPWVNFAPLVIDIKDGGIPEELLEGTCVLAPYHLRSDYFPSDPHDINSCPRTVYKICVMPHTLPYLARFVDDLDKADLEWKSSH